MKRFAFCLVILALAALACGSLPTPEPTFDFHVVETIAAATLTAMVPTKSPPTLIPLPTMTLVTIETAVPTVTPFLMPAYGRPVRIEFAPNAVAATVKGIVYFPDRREYILYAFEGQQMTVEITSDNDANFAILGMSTNQPLKRFENEDRTWTGFLPGTQDYVIQVAVPSGSANFTLTVTIIWV